MYISCEFFKSIVSGMGLATGTLISMHLYTYFCDDLFDEKEIHHEDDVKSELNKEFIRQQEISTQTNEHETKRETGLWTRIFIMLSEYYYFRM